MEKQNLDDEKKTLDAIKQFLDYNKYIIDIMFSPPARNKKQYIDFVKNLFGEQKDDEVMFADLIPESYMIKACLIEVNANNGFLPIEFFTSLSKLLKFLAANKTFRLKKYKGSDTDFSISADQQASFPANMAFEDIAGIVSKERYGGTMETYSEKKYFQQIISDAESNPAIDELAEKLGRDENSSRKKIKKQASASQKIWQTHSSYKGQIAGLKLGNNISSVINSELALYKYKPTKKVFLQKFAQNQLLSYSYKSRHLETVKGNKEIEESPPSTKGSVLVCVDTSGSMMYTMDFVKSLAYRLSEIVREEKRRCYIIAFSKDYMVFDIGYRNKKSSRKDLKDFLRIDASGGTDPTEAFKYAIDLIENKDWKDADVLTVSDFEMADLDPGLERRIKNLQKNKTKFYGLLTPDSEYSDNSNIDAMKSFDENYYYHKSKGLVRM